MSDMQTMIRTQIAVNGELYLLSQDQDADALMERIEAAARSDGSFVHFVVLGNRRMSVLVTSRTEVVVTVETVQFDARDTGDEATPFGGFFDFDVDMPAS